MTDSAAINEIMLALKKWTDEKNHIFFKNLKIKKSGQMKKSYFFKNFQIKKVGRMGRMDIC